MATGRRSRAAMRSATRSAWARPSSARWSPAAWPGSSLPVVGVLPCRTSSATVVWGAALRRRAGFLGALRATLVLAARVGTRAKVERRGGDTGAIVRWSGGPARTRPSVSRPPERRDRGLSGLPATGRLARAGGGVAAGRLRRRALLGPPRRGLRRPGRPPRRGGPGAGRARRQPDRARVHRRPLGGLALRRAVPRRVRQPTDEHRARRRPRPHRRLGDRGGALRAARQQADARRARAVPA